jgi:hypothetical protein
LEEKLNKRIFITFATAILLATAFSISAESKHIPHCWNGEVHDKFMDWWIGAYPGEFKDSVDFLHMKMGFYIVSDVESLRKRSLLRHSNRHPSEDVDLRDSRSIKHFKFPNKRYSDEQTTSIPYGEVHLMLFSTSIPCGCIRSRCKKDRERPS